jgi:hypothetical protein
MSRKLLVEDAPFAAPVALSIGGDPPLWEARFRRITPGALSLRCAVLFSFAGGQS